MIFQRIKHKRKLTGIYLYESTGKFLGYCILTAHLDSLFYRLTRTNLFVELPSIDVSESELKTSNRYLISDPEKWLQEKFCVLLELINPDVKKLINAKESEKELQKLKEQLKNIQEILKCLN